MTEAMDYETINQKAIAKALLKAEKCKNEDEKKIYLNYAEDLRQNPVKEAKRKRALNQSKLKRKKILTGDLIKITLAICMPIAIYGLFNSAYNLVDSIISSSISAGSVSTVSALAQVKSALQAFGAGVAAGGAIIVARNYGAGDIDTAKKNSAVLLTLILLVSALVVIILIPCSGLIIDFAQVENSKDTTLYFSLQLFELAIVAVNTMFIGLEKAKGNSKSVMGYNILVLLVKLTFTLFFIYILNIRSIILIEVSTIIGQTSLLIIGLVVMFGKKNILRLSVKKMSLRWKYVKPILAISIPIFFGKFVMSLGKVIVNSMCGSFYNVETDGLIVGALAVSNNLSGLVTTPTNAFEEGGSTIVSQNLGAKNMKRAVRSFYKNLLLVSIVSLIGFILVRFVFLDQLVDLFNTKKAASMPIESNYETLLEFQEAMAAYEHELERSAKLVKYIKEVFTFDCISIPALGVTASVLALLYGFGQTYLSGILNFSRIGSRIVVLLLCKFAFKMDYRAAGVSMGISNTLILLISTSFLIYFLVKIKKKGFKDMKITDPEPEFVEIV